MSDPPSHEPRGAGGSSPPGEISGFDLQRRLGAGGMAEVFLAKKRGAEGTYKQLVVKRILPEHSASRRFRHMFVEEAQLATRLNHPNIVQVYEFSHHGDDLLLSMEYVEGVDLGKLMRSARKRKRKTPYWVAAFIVAEVAKGLHYAHERKDEGGLPLEIVHRDVSPQNILISYGGVVKIADFGIASANLFREEAGVLKGKFSYMSPEQARGEKVDRRSDIYALGVVMYELLTRRSPYGALKEDALAEAVRFGTIKPPTAVDAQVPPALEAITMRALARRPAERYQTARELAADIARALLEERQLVDNSSVEESMAETLGRDGALGGEPEQRTLAAIRKPRTAASEASVLGTAADHLSPSRRVVREVRHVAMVKMRLDGIEALRSAQSDAVVRRTLDSLRSTLEDIAYKHQAVWSWESEVDAYAVTGLMANPSRAPSDAVLIAVDTHEFLASHSEDLPVQVRASIAIVRGIADGVRDDQGHLVDHALHRPANYLAEQLGGFTPFGKTWVAGGVYRLVRRELRWSDGPLIDLKDAHQHNVPDRMRVYVLMRPLTVEERLAEMALNPNDLVGRDAEKADLHAAYHRAVYHPGVSTPPPGDVDELQHPPRRAAGRSGELLARVLVGEMGIGKTALVDTFVGELPAEARVFRVECSPVKIDLPYATVVDLLREATDVGPDDDFDTAAEAVVKILRGGEAHGRVDRVASRLAELMTGREVKLQDEDAAAQHHDFVQLGVRLLFGSIAAETPVVIVIDGMQWADRASLELLQHILARDEPLPVLTVLLTRTDERVEPYLEGLMRTELRGLEPDQQIRLVQARLGVREGVAQVCRELVPRVGGNPYFLLEMVDALLERGSLEIVEPADGGEPVLVRREDRFGSEAEALPSTIEQLVGDRLAELPHAEHDVVDWLAVAGGPLSQGDLMALTRLTDDEAITRLCARGLCDRRGRAVDFRHPLARDVAYQALDPVQRARMHRRLGEYLATTALAKGLSAAIVAQHLERGEAPRQAAELFLEAAQAARHAHQTQLALRYYERTLALLPMGDSRRLSAHEALERSYRHLGQGRERKVHLEALCRLAREARHGHWLALALVRRAQLDLDEGSVARGLPVAQRAADLARMAKQPELEVEALIALCELLRDLGDVNGALDAIERALDVASSPRVTRRARGEVLRAKGVLLRRAGRLHAALEAHAEAIAIFNAAGARRSEARARNALGFVLFVLGRYEDSIAMCLSSIAIDVMIGGRFQVAKTLANVGMAYARLGDTQRGLAYLGRARDAHERYEDYDGRVDTWLVTASALLEEGRIEEGRDLLREAAQLPAATNVYNRIHQLIVVALMARSQRDAASACAYAAEARQLAQAQALVSYHVYATAIEGAARVDAGDTQTGVLLATNALGAVEAMEGSEYGIEVRSLCCEAAIAAQAQVRTVASPSLTADVCRRALDQVDRIAGYIRDPRLRDLFFQRPAVKGIVEHATRFAARDADMPFGIRG
jgi:serine/threonine protein kinase/tetratricopeptide (TPR) repeat protein